MASVHDVFGSEVRVYESRDPSHLWVHIDQKVFTENGRTNIYAHLTLEAAQELRDHLDALIEEIAGRPER